jgi:hypothetical protein
MSHLGSSILKSQGLMTPAANQSPTKSPVGFKLVPDFDRAQKRDTIFSACSRAKTIIGHFEGRH